VDYSDLQSYAWKPADEGERGFSTPESNDHFQSAMDDLLTTKGFSLSPEAPDFLIEVYSVKSYKETYKTINGYAEFPKEMIRINFLDPSSNREIYESAAYAYMSGNEKQEAKNAIIDDAVEALLSEFPPVK